MEEIRKIGNVKDYNNCLGVDTLHPLVSIVNFDDLPEVQTHRLNMSIYAVLLKNIKCGDLRYGNSHYDYADGTLIFIAPGLAVRFEGVSHHNIDLAEVIRLFGKKVTMCASLENGSFLSCG